MADFYNTFEEADSRIGNKAYAGVTEVSGLKPGFLVGQQYNEANAQIKDRQGNPLSYTKDVALVETNKNANGSTDENKSDGAKRRGRLFGSRKSAKKTEPLAKTASAPMVEQAEGAHNPSFFS